MLATLPIARIAGLLSLLPFATSISAQQLQFLHNHVRPAVSSGRASQVGALPSTQRLQLGFHLPVRNHTQLVGLIDQLSDPRNPNYRHWLSVAEFTQQFGPSEEDYQKAVAYAKANGFTIRGTSPNRLLLSVTATTEQIEKAFHVHMNVYRHPTENRTFYSPDAEPSLSLDFPLSHISGLNNYSLPRPAGGPGPRAIKRSFGSGPSGAFTASDMRIAYNMGSNTGSGQVVALVELSGYNPSDVNLYFSNSGLSNLVPIVNISVDGSSPGSYTVADREGEVCLDLEQVIGLAPGLSSVRVYFTASGGYEAEIFNRIVTDNLAKQVSNSWYWYPDDPTFTEPYFEEAAVQGQTIFTASGDHGAYTGNDADGSYPSEEAYLTSVGGTTLTVNSAHGWQSESAWNQDGEGTGGGPADDGTAYFAIPVWQAPVINSSNAGSSTLRNVPDVALQSDYSNYICYESGTCATNWGGTSFATPRWAAWLALVNQQLAANGQPGGLGMINPTLYGIGQSSRYKSDFHDVTAGSNATAGQFPYWSAVPGYDLTTGWGSLNGLSLMADLISPSFALFPSADNLIIRSGAAGSVTLSLSSAAGFTGQVALAVSGLPSGVSATITPSSVTPAVNGIVTATLTVTAASTASFGESTLTISGVSGAVSASASLNLVVGMRQVPVFSSWYPSFEAKPHPESVHPKLF